MKLKIVLEKGIDGYITVKKVDVATLNSLGI